MLLFPSVVVFLPLASALAQPPDPELLQRYSEVGQRALAERRYPEAEQAYEKLRELSPQTAEVHAGLGFIYYQQRKFAQAVPPLRQAIKLNPSLPRTDILLALCLSELGQYKEAVPGLRKAFKQTADDPLRRLAGLQLTRAYTGLEQDDKAVEVAVELTRVYPNDPEILYHSARLLSNYAYLTTIKLARVAPTSPWTHQAAGEANESQGLYEAALREYRRRLDVGCEPARHPPAHRPHPPGPRRGHRRRRSGRGIPGRSGPGVREGARPRLDERHRRLRARGDPSARRTSRSGPAPVRGGGRPLSRLRAGPPGSGARAARGGEGRAGGPSPAQRAVALDPQSDVAYYQLARAYQVVGNVAGQKEALAQYQVLRAHKRDGTDLSTVPLQVTKQPLEAPEGPP